MTSTQRAPTPTGDFRVNGSLTPNRRTHSGLCPTCGQKPKHPKRERETPDYVAGMRRLIRALLKRVSAGDVEEFVQFKILKQDLKQAEQEAATALNEECDYSWEQIGRTWGLTKQGAQQKWARKADK